MIHDKMDPRMEGRRRRRRRRRRVSIGGEKVERRVGNSTREVGSHEDELNFVASTRFRRDFLPLFLRRTPFDCLRSIINNCEHVKVDSLRLI